MPTPLTKPLKRELQIQGRAFVVTLSPEGIKLVLKGKRKGQELRWEDLVSGEAALAVALNASLKGLPEPGSAAAGPQTGPDDDHPSLPPNASNSPRRGSTRKRIAKRKSNAGPRRRRPAQ